MITQGTPQTASRRPPGLDLLAQDATPYLDAVVAHAQRETVRLHVPGHKGGAYADAALVDALGEQTLALDIPKHIRGVDLGGKPTPLELAETLAAQAWGARRTWFLTNGASQGNHAACLALGQAGEEVVVQGNVHSSTIDGLVLSGLRPRFVNPVIDTRLGVAHTLTTDGLADALDANPAAVAAIVVSPTYFGVCADLAGLAKVAHSRGVALIVDEAWGAHLAFHEHLPMDALTAGADLVISSTHKVVGSLTQSAMVHLGHGAPDWLGQATARALVLVGSTSPSALLLASLDAARRQAAVEGRARLGQALLDMARLREEIRSIPGLGLLDHSCGVGPGAHEYDPLSLSIDLTGSSVTGYELDRALFEIEGIDLELVSANVIVALFGMAEPIGERGGKLVSALREQLSQYREIAASRSSDWGEAVAVDGSPDPALPSPFASAPPRGALQMTPRDAFLGPCESVAAADAVGRIAAESLMAYPPGIPVTIPGEHLTAESLDYCREVLARGGSLRGASDPALETVKVVVERRPAAYGRERQASHRA